jgi:hypothetical protein
LKINCSLEKREHDLSSFFDRDDNHLHIKSAKKKELKKSLSNISHKDSIIIISSMISRLLAKHDILFEGGSFVGCLRDTQLHYYDSVGCFHSFASLPHSFLLSTSPLYDIPCSSGLPVILAIIPHPSLSSVERDTREPPLITESSDE